MLTPLLYFKSIHNQNPFVVPALLLLVLLLVRRYFASRPGPYRPYAQRIGRKWLVVLGVLLAVLLVLVPVFEAYFQLYECQVSQSYMRENIELAQRAFKVLDQHSIPYWVDYASLLSLLRGQQLNKWEQDVDLSIIHPAHMQSMRNMPLLPDGGTLGPLLDRARKHPDQPGLPISVDHLMHKMKEEGFQVTYSKGNDRRFPDRMLIQLWGKVTHGPHVDLWLWSAGAPGSPFTTVPSPSLWSASEPPVLWTGEADISYNPRPLSDIFPLVQANWLGTTVTIPKDHHGISEKEYGGWGGSYMAPQVFRGDCFHNFFQMRYLY